MSKAQIDAFLGKWTSRKLMVFIVATLLTLFGDVTSSDWVTIAAIYIGGQTVVDSVAKIKQSN